LATCHGFTPGPPAGAAEALGTVATATAANPANTSAAARAREDNDIEEHLILSAKPGQGVSSAIRL
jgi:hypothetical protein